MNSHSQYGPHEYIRHGIGFSRDDLSWDLARDAHYWSSFSPARRADTHQRDYVNVLLHVATVFEGYVQANPDRAELASTLFADFRAGYHARYVRWLNAMSRTASPMVTGGSNFPTRRNAKALESEQRRSTDLNEWYAWFLKRAGKRMYDRPEERTADGRLAKLLADLKAAEDRHALMVNVNTIVRTKKAQAALAKRGLTVEQGLLELGLTPKLAAGYMTPDSFGYLGFAPFELTNSSARIRRMKAEVERAQQRVKAVEAVQEAGEAPTTEVKGVQIVEDPEDNRLRLIFPDRPKGEVYVRLKQRGFKWSPRNGAWQRQLTNSAREAAQYVLAAV